MILIGIDDTDVHGSKDTVQLAKAIAQSVSSEWKCERIVRHQLLTDHEIPMTSRNGAASILLSARHENEFDNMLTLIHHVREVIKSWFVKGSDPGLCVCPLAFVTEEVVKFGYRCQFEIVRQAEALQIANEAEVHLEGLGGTNGGMIGALAAVGLAARGNDGRVMQIGESSEDLTGPQPVRAIESLGIVVQNFETGEELREGTVNLGKSLRPNLRDNRIVLFVEKQADRNDGLSYHDIKLP